MTGGQRGAQSALPKPTPANLRKFAETPVARRAINVVKDRIASMDWQVRVRRGYDAARGAGCGGADGGAAAVRSRSRTPRDCFRALWEQVLEDLLVGGFGAVEMEATGDPDAAVPPVGGGWRDDPDRHELERRSERRRAMRRATGGMGTRRAWCRCAMTS